MQDQGTAKSSMATGFPGHPAPTASSSLRLRIGKSRLASPPPAAGVTGATAGWARLQQVSRPGALERRQREGEGGGRIGSRVPALANGPGASVCSFPSTRFACRCRTQGVTPTASPARIRRVSGQASCRTGCAEASCSPAPAGSRSVRPPIEAAQGVDGRCCDGLNTSAAIFIKSIAALVFMSGSNDVLIAEVGKGARGGAVGMSSAENCDILPMRCTSLSTCVASRVFSAGTRVVGFCRGGTISFVKGPSMATTLARRRRTAFLSQSGCCYYCGNPMWSEDPAAFARTHGISIKQARLLQATAEHLQARQDGGGDDAGNIVAACLFCNRRRHARRNPPAPATYLAMVRNRLKRGAWNAWILPSSMLGT